MSSIKSKFTSLTQKKLINLSKKKIEQSFSDKKLDCR